MADIITMILTMFLDIWKGITGTVDVIFLDTHYVKSIMFFRKRKTFRIGKREYSVVNSFIRNNTIYYASNCSEPAKVGQIIADAQGRIIIPGEKGNPIQPVQPEICHEKTVYFFDTYETYLKLRNTIIEKMMVSSIPKKIDMLLIVLVIIGLMNLFIIYKIGQIPGMP